MAEIGYGADVKYGDGETMTSMGCIESINVPSPEAGQVETTCLANVDRYKTFIPGLVDPGMVEVTVLWDAASYGALLALVGTVASFEVIFNDAFSVTFSAFVTKCEASIGGVEEVKKFTVSAKVSGSITIVD